MEKVTKFEYIWRSHATLPERFGQKLRIIITEQGSHYSSAFSCMTNVEFESDREIVCTARTNFRRIKGE